MRYGLTAMHAVLPPRVAALGRLDQLSHLRTEMVRGTDNGISYVLISYDEDCGIRTNRCGPRRMAGRLGDCQAS